LLPIMEVTIVVSTAAIPDYTQGSAHGRGKFLN